MIVMPKHLTSSIRLQKRGVSALWTARPQTAHTLVICLLQISLVLTSELVPQPHSSLSDTDVGTKGQHEPTLVLEQELVNEVMEMGGSVEPKMMDPFCKNRKVKCCEVVLLTGLIFSWQDL